MAGCVSTQCLLQCLLVYIQPLCVEELAEILTVDLDGTVTPLFNDNFQPLRTCAHSTLCVNMVCVAS